MTPLHIARAIAHRDAEALDRIASLVAADGPPAVETWTLFERTGRLAAFAMALADAGAGRRLSERHHAALRSAVEVAAVKNALIRRVAVDATRHLAADRLPALWVKGVWLAHFVYARPAERAMSDADIFVPSGCRRAAVECLVRHGYATDPLTDAAGLEVFADALRPPAALVPPAHDLAIDVHDAVHVSARRSWPVDDMWRQAREVSIGRAGVRVPTLEDGLRLVAMHALKHGLDVRHLVTAVGDVAAIFRAGTIDVDRATAGLGDPFEATALYVVIGAVDDGQLPDAARVVRERASHVLDRHRARRVADRLLQAADHPSFVRAHDFSLFGLGELGVGPSVLSHLSRGVRRWRRRVKAGGPGRQAGPARTGAGGINWRWAWMTYRAGRLSGRLSRSRLT